MRSIRLERVSKPAKFSVRAGSPLGTKTCPIGGHYEWEDWEISAGLGKEIPSTNTADWRFEAVCGVTG